MEFGTEDEFDFIALKYDEMPMSQGKFQATQSFAVLLGKIKDTGKFKRGVDMIAQFRDAIPKAYRNQTDPYFNDRIFSELIKKKSEAGLMDQAEYLKSVLPK
jgi:hypothetical protein